MTTYELQSALFASPYPCSGHRVSTKNIYIYIFFFFFFFFGFKWLGANQKRILLINFGVGYQISNELMK